MVLPVNLRVKLRKKRGPLEASFNDPTDLHCSFIFKDVALGRTENLRREARTVKNSGDGTGEERMASQILVEYYMVYPIISSILLGNHIQDFIEVIVMYCLITPKCNKIHVNYM